MRDTSALRSKIWVIALLVAVVLVLFPLLRGGFFVSDDGDWMVIRLSAFHQSLREGQFPVRYLGRLNYSYGYPVANFLYPGFLYIGSVLKTVGLPFTGAVKVVIGASMLVSAAAIFAWLKRRFSVTAGFVGAASFLLSPYLLFDVYKRGSVGEVLATAAAAVAVWSISERAGKALPLAIGLLLVSHNTLGLMYMVMLAGYIVVLKAWKLFVPYVIGMLLASFFWMPAMFERRFVVFDAVTVANPAAYFGHAHTLILTGIAFILAALVVRGTRDGQNAEGRYFLMLLVGAGLIASYLSFPLWRLEPLVRLVQFPYRFLSLWFFAGPWLVAAAVHALPERKRDIFAGIIIVSLAVPAVVSITRVAPTRHDEGFYTTNEATTTVADEYMPKWVVEKPGEHAPTRYVLLSGEGKLDPVKATTQTVELTARMAESGVVRINSVFYPGWGAMLDDRPVEIDYQNPRGLLDIHIPKGEHRLLVTFRETAFRFIADVVSVMALAWYILYVLVSGKTAKRVFKILFRPEIVT